jgi:predicted DNA-binding protein
MNRKEKTESIRIPRELKEQVALIAKQQRRSLRNQLELILELGLEELKEKENEN